MIAWLAYYFHWSPSDFKKLTITEFLWWYERAEYIAAELTRARTGR